MLDARGGVEDRIAGLDEGADDYMVKPFALGELLARMRRCCGASGSERNGHRVGRPRADGARQEVRNGHGGST